MRGPLSNRDGEGSRKEERSGTGKCWLRPMIITI